ncbi:Cof-type HAD-IIB family hydrolase [Cytobacillus sp. FJAT-54145]|uniref:Cof-type HAD-IIB family hydrolase n=1 Tax=Cytobacillus spartinae TaxID=3299023 RepID=A0ABW6KEG0_9BACI
MIKCIAIDMDGTLMSSAQELTKENIEAIKKAQAQGVEVVIATGRSHEEAGYVLEEAGIQCPFILVNGAEVRSSTGEILITNPLNKDTAKKIEQILVENGLYEQMYTNKGVHTTDKDKGIATFVDIAMSANPEVDRDVVEEEVINTFGKFLQEVESYQFIYEDHEIEVYKQLAFSFDIRLLAQVSESLKKMDGLAISSSGHENIEITSAYAQKGIALEKFVAERGISLEETMAIGDNYNDISMFERVGRAVAMGNADDTIKSYCQFVTASNNESGVAKAILEALNMNK